MEKTIYLREDTEFTIFCEKDNSPELTQKIGLDAKIKKHLLSANPGIRICLVWEGSKKKFTKFSNVKGKIAKSDFKAETDAFDHILEQWNCEAKYASKINQWDEYAELVLTYIDAEKLSDNIKNVVFKSKDLNNLVKKISKSKANSINFFLAKGDAAEALGVKENSVLMLGMDDIEKLETIEEKTDIVNLSINTKGFLEQLKTLKGIKFVSKGSTLFMEII